MGDLPAVMMDRLSLIFGAPPWIAILTLIFIVALVAGMGMLVRDRARGGGRPNWRRDPEEMQDLSPRLRRARLQMIGAAIAMVFVGLVAVLNLFQ